MPSLHEHYEHNGEPGCHTLEEVKKMFRNFWDPTTYWQFETQGKPAVLKRCPQSKLFMDTKGCCVDYTEWKWTEPTEPPSKPNKG